MSDLFIDRAVAPVDLEVRSDGRTVYGLAVPFDREATVNDGYGNYREVFRRGSFSRTINGGVERVKFLVNHDRKRLPIGKAVNLREDAAGLVGEFRVSATRDGDEAIQLVRDGVLDAFSVGFAPVKDREQKGLVERLEVKLREVSVVAFPAYEGATIAGVRSLSPDLEALIEAHGEDTIRQFIELARTLDTHRTEPAAGTSEGDPSTSHDDSVVGHSSRIPTREQRIAAAILQGVIK